MGLLGRILAVVCLVPLAVTGCAAAPELRALTGREEAELHDAEQFLVRDCMARHGFRLWITTYDRRAEPERFPYVIDDIDWASRHGYGTELRRNADARADSNKVYFDGLPAEGRKAAVAALNGTGPGRVETVPPAGGLLSRYDNGCTSQTWRELYGDLAAWYRASKIAEALPGLWRGRVVTDPAFTAAVARWSGCMKEAGLPYESPAAARAAISAPDAGAGGDGEIRTAVAEATCAGRTGLAATARELDRSRQADVRAEYREGLETRLRLQLAALPRAGAAVKNAQR
ncbi:hypothetical protein ACFQ05_18305 [Amycolatopsis umgeniensis]|uniref:Lipoprotein n=1 Tax=Amycolatopsis umgeniensis TaxID=336628 RepID=A0A841BF86_9PSEU|nr:hypothetical protein [Amycolatopsis umgeniensis]MBB5857561.1 hypothetical protein [Amycolatopsis umgeniensis]